MKTLKTILLFYLIANSTVGYCQDTNMNKAVEEIIVLGKDSIVQLALALIDEKVEIQIFSKIKVVANGRKVYLIIR